MENNFSRFCFFRAFWRQVEQFTFLFPDSEKNIYQIFYIKCSKTSLKGYPEIKTTS